MGTTAVDVQHVSKRFRLFQEKYTTLKERLIHAGRVPYNDLWALSDVAFSVSEGETLGILGRNGSGKSTLLKCICGVLQPTSGRVVVEGNLAALLELGAGFQQELSGRDNIYLNGSLLGLSRRDVDKRFDDIVAFAELEQFIDNQVKFYSSGMYVRLGFAVAVNIDPDILVIDEVLAVGDERFQRKCMERVRQFQQEGRTIILVSHAPDQVRGVCNRALVMEGGRMITIGPPGEVVRVFREQMLEAGGAPLVGAPTAGGEATTDSPEAVAGGETVLFAAPSAPAERLSAQAGVSARPVRITDVTAQLPHEDQRPYLHPGEQLTIRVGFEVAHPLQGVEFLVELREEQLGVLYRTDTGIMGTPFDLAAGAGAMEFVVDAFPFLDGAYEATVGVRSKLGGELYDWRESACRFEVVNPGRDTGVVGLKVRASSLPAMPQTVGSHQAVTSQGQPPAAAAHEESQAVVSHEEGVWSQR